jgi:ABC-type transporter Mla subunit MlaD
MAQILAFPQKPEDRLRAALRSLEAALAEQKDAFGALRTNLAALGGAVSGLETSVHGYRGALAGTVRELDVARSSAQRLEATADTWMNRSG